MNADLLQQAIGEIDESYIEEAHAPVKKRRHSLRGIGLLAAVVAALALLTGGIFAAVGWFSLSPVSNPEEKTGFPFTNPNVRIQQATPQTWITLSDEKEGSYVGFRLENFPLEEGEEIWRNPMDSFLEEKGLLGQTNLPEQRLEDFCWSCAWEGPSRAHLLLNMLDRGGLGYRQYFTRSESRVLWERFINGMDVVCLELSDSEQGTMYHLICHHKALRFVLIASTNLEPELAAEVLEGLSFLDTGVSIPRSETEIHYGFRVRQAPEGCLSFYSPWNFWYSYLENARLRTPKMPAELADVFHGTYDFVWEYPANPEYLQVSLWGPSDGMETVWEGELLRTGTINGRPASWYQSRTYYGLTLSFEEEGVQISLWASKRLLDDHPELLERTAEQIELVKIEIEAWPPQEFIFGVG